jgi:hypothetical protein
MDDGGWITDEAHIRRLFVMHYKSLYNESYESVAPSDVFPTLFSSHCLHYLLIRVGLYSNLQLWRKSRGMCFLSDLIRRVDLMC